MHIANQKTVHIDCSQFTNSVAAKEAVHAYLRGDPDVVVFHQSKQEHWDLIRLVYETGAEVVLTPYPDRYVAPSSR